MGKRGEGWFVLQMLLFALIFFAPQATCFACPAWLKGVGLALLAVGGVLGTWGMVTLGRNLTPFPKPVEGGTLVTHGPYRLVRHPIYAGLILGTLGWSLFRANLLGLALAALLFVFFDLKSRREEQWLREIYPDYAAYQARVKKLVPWIY
ncbi:MAG: isoprenylcysteine carboxylmethyltransferase family protein [Caldilineales bacterium]|nr:isoprenylcysteine carboxylmethyltransferase family protein [Caldilineales bacterium]MDW8319107.1 isoprenylcysteine carboxylmethyltransferase family protein [Anaerolineae bacterium]